jgi:hypothetical protein
MPIHLNGGAHGHGRSGTAATDRQAGGAVVPGATARIGVGLANLATSHLILL